MHRPLDPNTGRPLPVDAPKEHPAKPSKGSAPPGIKKPTPGGGAGPTEPEPKEEERGEEEGDA